MEEQVIQGQQFEVAASVELIENLFEDFALFMKDYGLDLEAQQNWKLIFMEAVTNAVVHGNNQDPESKVQVTWSIRGDKVVLEIMDKGKGPGSDADYNLPKDKLDTNGRGLFLIKELSDSYEHWVSPNGHKQIIIKQHEGLDANAKEGNLLTSTLDELSHSYESLTAFYQLGESLIKSEDIGNFISNAINNLGEVVEHNVIFITLGGELEPNLLTEIRALPYPGLKFTDPLLLKERVWETPGEIADNEELRPYAAGIMCPIRAGEESIGSLTVARNGDKDYLNAGELNTIRTFADLLGIAIAQANNAILRDQAQRAISELEIASALQKKLLPLPSLPNHDTWTLFTERKSAREVAGDYVDAGFNNHGSLFLITVDVMGKGVPAAFLASMVRTAFHINLDTQKTLSGVAHALNKVICDQIQDLTIFATCSIAHIPQPYDKIEIVNAGHCSPILMRDNKVIHQVEPSGPPLGIFDDSQYEVETFELKKHDQLLMVTDGLYEWTYNNHIWGWENFLEFVPQHLEHPSQLWDALLKKIAENNPGAETGDDQTMLYWELTS